MNLARNIASTLTANVATLALSLGSSIVLARMLGPDGRGLFALVLLVPELATTFGLFGFEQAHAVYAGLEPTKRRVLVWHSTILAAVIGVFTSVGGMFSSGTPPSGNTSTHRCGCCCCRSC